MARHHRGAEVWRIALVVADAAGADAAAAALGTICGAVSAFEQAPSGDWLVEGFAVSMPERAIVETTLALAWLPRGTAPPAPSIERVPPRDWLAENRASFPPLLAGRYFVHGSHYRGAPPPGRIALVVDAATAFGSGEHASTRGCLMALDSLAKRRRRPRVLDMGTGSGILAIAAARTWRCPVVARDVDAEAVRVAARNAAVNGVAAALDIARADGYRGLRRARSFDLILANILARPLALMAPALACALAPGAIAVLSGLLARQERAVLAAHRLQGLHLRRRIAVEGWHTLVLARRGC